MSFNKGSVALVSCGRAEMLVSVIFDGPQYLRGEYVVLQVLARFLVTQEVRARMPDQSDYWGNDPLNEERRCLLAFVRCDAYPHSDLVGDHSLDIPWDNGHWPQLITNLDEIYPAQLLETT